MARLAEEHRLEPRHQHHGETAEDALEREPGGGIEPRANRADRVAAFVVIPVPQISGCVIITINGSPHTICF